MVFVCLCTHCSIFWNSYKRFHSKKRIIMWEGIRYFSHGCFYPWKLHAPWCIRCPRGPTSHAHSKGQGSGPPEGNSDLQAQKRQVLCWAKSSASPPLPALSVQLALLEQLIAHQQFLPWPRSAGKRFNFYNRAESFPIKVQKERVSGEPPRGPGSGGQVVTFQG